MKAKPPLSSLDTPWIDPKTVASRRRRFLALLALLLFSFVCGTLPVCASAYPVGFVWQRSANWVLSSSIPSLSSLNDTQGNAVWNYTCVNGGSLINDAGTNKWWMLSRTNLTPGLWGATAVFLNGTKLPYFNKTYMQMAGNDVTIAPIAVWKNPAGDGVFIGVSGSVAWIGPGTGTNTIPVDYVVAKHRVADDSWLVLDSAVFAPVGGAAPANARTYNLSQPLSAGDEIVWGFKRSANFNNGVGWMDLSDNLSFTLLTALSVSGTDIVAAAPVTGTANAVFTVTSSSASSVPVTVQFATVDGSATAGVQYAATSGTLVFAPGETIKTVCVPIFSNPVPQPDLTFSLVLSNPTGGALLQSSALCTIVTSALPPPENLTAIVSGIAGIDLSWNEPWFLPSGYILERSVNGGEFTALTQLPVGTTAYRDANVQPGISYSYVIAASNTVVSASSTAAGAVIASGSNTFPASAFQSISDYGLMWWRSGVRGERVWQIMTSRYGMTFDCDSLSLSTIFPLAGSIPEAAALVQPNAQSFPASAPASRLSCTLTSSGSAIAIVANSNNNNDAHLLECGKFFQRRWQVIKTASGPVLSATQSGLEICAWPDRVSIVYRVIPTSDISSGGLDMTLTLSSIYNLLASSGAAQALAANDGSGFVILKSASSGTIAVDGSNARVTVHTDGGTWLANQERSVGLVIYPSTDAATAVSQADTLENKLLTVTGTQVAPTSVSLTSQYDPDRGFYKVSLRNDATATDPNRVERSRITVSNTTSAPRLARIEFNKDGIPYIQGASSLLRDLDGNPLGIPVQLSKDWHTGGSVQRWQGYWFHGLTMMVVPANTTLRFEVFLVGQNYGGVPAASHSQLCLVGYSTNGNQQWEEMAIGCWGESLCHDPESDLANAIGTDSRPLLLLSSGTAQKQWTGNYGGCDFLRYYDAANTRRFQMGIRTSYQRYGPGLTAVTYAGTTDNSKIAFNYTASIYRSNDCTRGRHHLRYDVLTDAAFTRMAFFQLASDNYNYNGGATHAYGYGNQLTPAAQWTTSSGTTTPVQLSGTLPWFSTIGCPVDSGVPSLTGVTRGFIVRSWKARINGQDGVNPWFVSSGSRFDVVPPPGVTALKAGDYVEAEIERVYFPQAASGYYGGDANLTTALQSYGNTHQMIIREAIGNNIAVSVTSGSLRSAYPVQVQASNNTAQFTISGGVGYVPIILTGLSDYRDPLLEELSNGTWVALNQATAGKDFWQSDYDADSASWQITFNVKLDSVYQDLTGMRDAPVSRTFRFRQSGAPSVAVAAPGAIIPGVQTQTGITLGAGDLPVSAVSVRAVSQDPDLLPNNSLLVAGSGSNLTLSFTPVGGTTGTATIAVYATDTNGKITVQNISVAIDAHQAWKERFFGAHANPSLTGDALDPDGDGVINLAEYAWGSNPSDPADRPKAAVAKSGTAVNASISAHAGRVYTLQRSTSLAPASWQEIARSATVQEDVPLILSDPSPPQRSAFYRISASAP